MSRHRIIIWFLLSGAVLGLTSCSERKLQKAIAYAREHIAIQEQEKDDK